MSIRYSKEVNRRNSIQKFDVDMIKDKEKMFMMIQTLMDVFTIIISYICAYYLRFYTHTITVNWGTYDSIGTYSTFLIYMVPMYLLIYYIFRLYIPKHRKHIQFEILNMILSNIFGIAFFVLVLYFQMSFNFSRSLLAFFFIINVILGISTRMVFHYYLKVTRKKV